MNKRRKKSLDLARVLRWIPRVLALFFIGFLSLFALDVIGQPQWVLGLLIHLIPSFVLLALTLVAWKRARLGGALFLLAGVALIGITRSGWLILPVWIVGGLFLLSSYLDKKMAT
jgi:hypothetical protein